MRTVQRWERNLRLPVHRIGTGKRSPVYANVAELKFWMTTSEAARHEYGGHAPDGSNGARGKIGAALVIPEEQRRPIENARRLLSTATELARKIAETSVRQRRQAEDLQARILRMRSRVK